MAATYALLVGIDEYLGDVPVLHGCVADATAMRALLTERIPDVHIRMLTDAHATTGAVSLAFTDHLGQASSGDTAIFWYAGHGSQARSVSPAGVEPDGLDETLVLHDSRTAGQRDLIDKELGALIARVARPGVHVFIGLDCCHAGSGTRDILPDDMTVRRAPTDLRIHRAAASSAPSRPTTPTASGWAAGGRHVLLAACRSDQTAKELSIAGQPRGALTAAVEQALRGTGGAQTYRDLLRMVRSALSMQLVPDQVAQLEVTNDGDDLGAIFNGQITERSAHFVATFDATRDRWTIDGGAVHGVPQRGSEDTRLAIYPLDAALDGSATSVAAAGIEQVLPQSSVLTTPTPVIPTSTTLTGALDPARAYAAVITAWPLPRVPVVLSASETDPSVAQAIRDHISASPFLTVADVGDLAVQVAGATTIIVDQARGTAPVAVWTQAVDPGVVVASVEQIVRYRQVVSLENPASSITPATVRMEINASENALRRPGEVRFPYVSSGTNWRPQKFTVTVRNSGDRSIWCALLAFGEDYSISGALLPGNVAVLKPQEEKVSVAITAAVPDSLWNAGVIRRIDVIKLVVSTEQFDPLLSVQAGLPRPVLDINRGDREAVTPNSFNRLLRRVQERDLLIDPTDDEPVVDWATQSIRIISERPRPDVELGRNVDLSPGVRLEVPADVTGTITVTSLDLVSRDAVVPLVPPMLIDQPEIWSSFSFQSERGGSAPLDVLELRNVQNPELVTPEQPIVVSLNGGVPDDESVLVIGFDGVNYLPVGRSVADGSGSIRIELLPPAIEGRSLTGSIRLLFRRLIHEVERQPAVETRLAIATIDPTGEVQYDDDPGHVRAAVASATRVLLLVHGILGDTRGMVLGSAAPAAPGRAPFGDQYALVLAFDYENINTPVSITAASLLAKLQAAGFDGAPGHRLDVIAHSMGGLVTRWMIELLGGAGIVHRLVTAGTPNGGSPWPVVEDWAIVTLSFGLNQLAQVFWPATIAAQLVKLVEKVDGALDDMSPGSDRLKALFAAPDPDLDYHVLIGNRALAVHPTPTGRVAALLAALKRKTVDVATDLAFFGEVNDLAVSVDSALHIPPGRTPLPTVVQGVECDHVTYFSSVDGLEKIGDALSAGLASHRG